ncbi:hypothetical protein MTR67_047727 [Solanum verrucosum]|uniref:Uncharacterized protein n=1 Tax=Solanum verrucosum TaxID=315347 RepID=A0AAF0UXL1_SOLVR|nr:hypothetical protein MTR67_047727 [Solanum verrucosum]
MTTTSTSLAVVTELRHSNIGYFTNEENLTIDWNDTFDCYYINKDVVRLDRFLNLFLPIILVLFNFELLLSLI